MPIRQGRTVRIILWVLPEAILHTPKLLHTVDPLWLFLGVHKTRKRLAEFWSAGAVRHPTQAGAVPVYFARFRVESATFGILGLRFSIGSGLGM